MGHENIGLLQARFFFLSPMVPVAFRMPLLNNSRGNILRDMEKSRVLLGKKRFFWGGLQGQKETKIKRAGAFSYFTK